MKRPSVEEMEKLFGFDKIEPIILSSGMQKDLEKEGDSFRDMYEEELWEMYKTVKNNK